jgi:hypothetical protein
VASPESTRLLALARRIVDALPPIVEEAGVTGSVSRGVADGVSDVELLLVTTRDCTLEECFDLAAAAGLEELDTWGPQGGPTRRVFGYFDGVPVELIWWSRKHAERSVEGSADAIVHAVPLRTHGALAAWQERLLPMPAQAAAEAIEEAAMTWGGFAPEGFLTIVRPGESLSRLERMVDDASRVLRLVHALNARWPPTAKRLAARAAGLAVAPERMAERIEEALLEREPRRALRLLAEVQLDAVRLAPDGPNVLRARQWLPRVIAVLGE